MYVNVNKQGRCPAGGLRNYNSRLTDGLGRVILPVIYIEWQEKGMSIGW